MSFANKIADLKKTQKFESMDCNKDHPNAVYLQLIFQNTVTHICILYFILFLYF